MNKTIAGALAATAAMIALIPSAPCGAAEKPAGDASAKQSAAVEAPLLEKREAVATAELTWIDGTEMPIEGRAFINEKHPYARLPEEAFSKPDLANIRSAIACPVGICFRFTTDSNVLCVRWSCRSKPPYGTHNATGVLVAGIDIYRQGEDGVWRFWMSGLPRAQTNEVKTTWTPNRPCTIYLPMSSRFESISIGIRRGAKIMPLGPRKSGVEKPVVVYGTSMVQGFSSSRPGMLWTSVVSRMLDVPVVNQGYSGNGKLEPSMCDYLAAIDASAYCFFTWGGQMTVETMREKSRPFLEKLHRARPDVPILVGEYYYVVGPYRLSTTNKKRSFVRELVAELKADDPQFWRNLYLVSAEKLFYDDDDGTVDSAHFNDRGAYRCAEAFSEVLREALRDSAASAAAK